MGKYVLIGLFHVSPPYNWRPSLILNQQEPSHYNPDILQIMASKLHHHLDSQLLNSLTTVDVVWIDTRQYLHRSVSVTISDCAVSPLSDVDTPSLVTAGTLQPSDILQLTSDLDRVTVAGKSNSKLVSERSVRAWLCSAVSSVPIWSWLTLAWSLICSRQWTLGHLQPAICQGQPAVLPQLSGTFLPQLQPLWSHIIEYISFSAAHLSPVAGTAQVPTFRRVCVLGYDFVTNPAGSSKIL